ncbi:hypothetical protein LTR62_006358 [Meristemomyces frigidus]|uniref:Guanine nucleotide exchange factor synembryn n=1 Tax=Meristemomyces frigidus TaxID=1508187 RepID=A0AAN7TBT7_9PEZI|nr:hypothetical protein LTR62_006358 [Meristemomyces frigidus]
MATGKQLSGRTTSGEGGLGEVDRLLDELERNLESARISLKQQEALLTKIKILGRDIKTATPIFTTKGINVLSKYGLDADASTTSREALRCLANAFLLDEPSRQIFVDLGYAPKAAERLKVHHNDDEFLISRILFLLTYNTELDFQALVDKHDLAGSVVRHVSRHAKTYAVSDITACERPPMEDAAMTETLKLLFNMTYYYPDMVLTFNSTIEPLISLIVNYRLPTPPLQQPVNNMLNALMNLDLQSFWTQTLLHPEAKINPLFPRAHPEVVVDRLVFVLEKAIKNYPERELDGAAASLCTLLRRSYELADTQVRSRMRWLLLPREKDRNKPLGQGDMLSSRLLRLSCSANLPTLRENISNLLFELSDKDATTFVQNIGYGFASGFLMTHNIAIPAHLAEASGQRSEGNITTGGDINPVTGQNLSAEAAYGNTGTDDMTEEEKEREAERLFVLFERLRATGVVDIKNPVQQAVEEGRFEELSD